MLFNFTRLLDQFLVVPHWVVCVSTHQLKNCYQVLWEWNKLNTVRHFLNTMRLLQTYLLAKILDTSHDILKAWRDINSSVLCDLQLFITLLKLYKTRENKTLKVKILLCKILLWFHKHRPTR